MMGKTCLKKHIEISYHRPIHMAIPLWYSFT